MTTRPVRVAKDLKTRAKDDGVMTLQDHVNDGSHKEVAVEVDLSIVACLEDPHDMLVHRLSLTTLARLPRMLHPLKLSFVLSFPCITLAQSVDLVGMGASSRKWPNG